MHNATIEKLGQSLERERDRGTVNSCCLLPRPHRWHSTSRLRPPSTGPIPYFNTRPVARVFIWLRLAPDNSGSNRNHPSQPSPCHSTRVGYCSDHRWFPRRWHWRYFSAVGRPAGSRNSFHLESILLYTPKAAPLEREDTVSGTKKTA